MRRKQAYLKDLLKKSKEQIERAEIRVILCGEKIKWLEEEIQKCVNAECVAGPQNVHSETEPVAPTPGTTTEPIQ